MQIFVFNLSNSPFTPEMSYLLTAAAVLMLRIANPLENEASLCMCVQTWFQIWLGFSLPAQLVTDMFTLSIASSRDKPWAVPKCHEAFTACSVTHWRQILQHPGDKGEMRTVAAMIQSCFAFWSS